MTELALIAALGIGSQWIAWRLKLPSILFLLASGFLAGPIMGWLDPDAMLGDLLMPLVSVSVGLILYEGGLSLKFSELRETGAVVRNLVTIGALVVFVLAAAAARFALGWPWSYAFLAGAILTVTGPTVVAPMLRVIRPNRHLGAILKWEGIVIDPIGAVLALVVFEVILGSQSGNGSPLWEILGGFGKTALVGSAFGAAGAGLLILFFRRYWVPDYLHNPFSLMVVVLAFAGSNALQHESGLLATTLMGVILANQKKAKVRHIIEFKENLRVLLISTLFIMLSARITSAQIEALPWGRTALFAGILILAVRPLSVLASTLGQKIGAPEKAMLAGMAPRGIVAAAVASIFAAGLADKGVPGPAEQFAPAIFAVIVATVCVYGLLGVPLARLLGISSGGDRGVLIVGAQPLCREIGLVLKSEDIDVLMVDTNRANATAARMEGLRSYYGNVLSDDVEESRRSRRHRARLRHDAQRRGQLAHLRAAQRTLRQRDDVSAVDARCRQVRRAHRLPRPQSPRPLPRRHHAPRPPAPPRRRSHHQKNSAHRVVRHGAIPRPLRPRRPPALPHHPHRPPPRLHRR
ncbi:MAG: sodium:proton antiporter [Verrucomicrobiales bacterium]